MLKFSPLYPQTDAAFYRALVILIFGFTFAVYASSLGNQFVFDDFQLVVENDYIKSLDHLADYLPTMRTLAAYRPVRFISYLIDYQLYGLQAWGFRLSNIIFHAINGILLFGLASLLGLSIEAALLSVFVFLCHPLQVESVAYISGRRDILFALFYFLAMVFYIRWYGRLNWKKNIILLTLLTLGLFAKEMAASFPLMAVWYAIWKEKQSDVQTRNRHSTDAKPFIRMVFLKAPALFIFLTVAVLGFIYYKVFIWNPSASRPYWGGSLINNVLTVALVWAYYIGLVLIPGPLKGDYSEGAFPIITDWHNLLGWLSLILLFAFFSLAFKQTRKRPVVAFGCIWFAIGLLPVSHLIPHHELMAEHYLYLPLAGFALIVGWVISLILKRYGEKTGIIVVVLLIGCYSIRDCIRITDWRDSFQFWKSTCRFEPIAARASLNLGLFYNDVGNEPKFLYYTRRSIAIKPSEKAWYNLAIYHQEHGDVQRAIVEYKKSIETNLIFEESYFNLGFLYEKIGQPKLGLDLLRSCPGFESRPSILFALGVINFQSGDQLDAAKWLRTLLNVDPQHEGAAYYLGSVYEKRKALGAAIEIYGEGLHNKDKYYQATFQRLYTCLGLLGRTNESIAAIDEYLREFPLDVEARLTLGRLRMAGRDYPAAEREFLEILHLDPHCAECCLALAIIQKVFHRDFSRAIEYFQKSLDLDPQQDSQALIKQNIESLKQRSGESAIPLP